MRSKAASPRPLGSVSGGEAVLAEDRRRDVLGRHLLEGAGAVLAVHQRAFVVRHDHRAGFVGRAGQLEALGDDAALDQRHEVALADADLHPQAGERLQEVLGRVGPVAGVVEADRQDQLRLGDHVDRLLDADLGDAVEAGGVGRFVVEIEAVFAARHRSALRHDQVAADRAQQVARVELGVGVGDAPEPRRVAVEPGGDHVELVRGDAPSPAGRWSRAGGAASRR